MSMASTMLSPRIIHPACSKQRLWRQKTAFQSRVPPADAGNAAEWRRPARPDLKS